MVACTQHLSGQNTKSLVINTISFKTDVNILEIVVVCTEKNIVKKENDKPLLIGIEKHKKYSWKLQ